MDLKTIYLIRHGETKGNAEKRYIGSRTDEPLSEGGRSKLKNQDVKMPVYSSPMLRCLQTVEALYSVTNPVVKDDLREIDFGDFEGGNYIELSENPDYQKWIDSNGEMPFPNGEKREDFINRSLASFMEIVEEEPGSELAIVCHGGNIMSIMSKLTGLGYYDFQVKCAEGYKLQIEIKDTGEIDVLSYDRLFGGADT